MNTQLQRRDQAVDKSTATTCLLCGEPNAEVLHELPHVWHQAPDSGQIVVRWCRSCATGFVAPQPDERRLRALYGSTYFESYGKDQTTTQRPSSWKALAWRLLTHVAWRMDRSCPVTASFVARYLPAGGTVCDLGCGPGTLLRELAAQGFQVCGVEPDPAAVQMCRRNGLNVWEGSAEALPRDIGARRFDAVVLTQVLEHCRAPLQALQAAISLLRPGGHLVVEVPNAGSSVAKALGPSWFHADVGRHLYFFTPKSVEQLTRRAGARVVETVFSDYTSQFVPARVQAEQQVWEALGGAGGQRRAYVRRAGGDVRGRRPSLWHRGMLLAGTALAPKRRRYGVVAVVAQRARD